MAILLVTGTPGVSRNIVAPSTSKWYIVKNGSNAEVVLKGSATTGVTIPAGVEALAFWNGSDFELVSMVGPSSSTDNAITRYDGTTGKVVQNSGVTIDDSNNISGVANLGFTGTGNRITGDFSNATVANRAIVQSSTTNDATALTIIPNGTSTTSALQLYNNTTGLNAGLLNLVCSSTEASFQSDRTGSGTFLPMTVYTGGAERMRLDTSGNLGLGVTPSAWSAGQGFQMKNGGVIASQGASFSVAANAFFASGTGWTYTTTSTATRYDQTSGAHQWFNAPSGTAGNTITFTQAMTLDTDGDLGIGTSSPSARLHVSSGALDEVARFEGTGNPYISVYDSGTRQLYFGSISASLVDLWVETNKDLRFATNNTERMRIDSSGLVGIGTNSPTQRLDVSDNLRVRGTRISQDNSGGNAFEIGPGAGTGDSTIWGFYAPTSRGIAFLTNTTERVRITSGGYFKASNNATYVASGNDFHEFNTNAADVVLWARNTNASPYGYYVDFTNDPNNASNYVFKAATGATNIYTIWSNGTVSARSDVRLKKNIETARNGYAEDLAKLRVVKYNWYNHEEGTPKELGFIAQEVEQVFPGLVITDKPGEENESKSIKTSVLVPMLVKAIQELKTELDSVKAELAALKGA
jgi:hypothetical protein